MNCCECDRRASFDILVPWTHFPSKKVGVEWMPFCWRCRANYTEEAWETRRRVADEVTR